MVRNCSGRAPALLLRARQLHQSRHIQDAGYG
jgi:hypothetical protein